MNPNHWGFGKRDAIQIKYKPQKLLQPTKPGKTPIQKSFPLPQVFSKK